MQSVYLIIYYKEEITMNKKINNYLNGVFAPYDNKKSICELKAELLADLQERFSELKQQGIDDETAFSKTIESIGDIEETVRDISVLSVSLERQVLTNFRASNLPNSDFKGVAVKGGKFEASALKGSDFSGADLTGSSFKSSDVSESNFDNANLTEATLTMAALNSCSFKNTILEKTNFNQSDLKKADFSGVRLDKTKLTMLDLRKTNFKNCTFIETNFKYSDLRGVNFDSQTFIGIVFEKALLTGASFKNAVIKNVSFCSTITFSKKYYRSVKTICFDGASMDKLTAAALKGMEADLSKVSII